jgi:hypothetical protein
MADTEEEGLRLFLKPANVHKLNCVISFIALLLPFTEIGDLGQKINK